VAFEHLESCLWPTNSEAFSFFIDVRLNHAGGKFFETSRFSDYFVLLRITCAMVFSLLPEKTFNSV